MEQVQIIQSLLHEIVMEIILWIALILLAGKVILKATRPDINRAVNKKLEEYWANLKDYF